MFNLKKQAKKEPLYEKMLQEQREHYDVSLSKPSVTEKLLADERGKLSKTITEVQMKDSRGFLPEGTTEQQLDHHKSPKDYVPMRDDTNDKAQVIPMTLLNAAYENEHLKAFRADVDSESHTEEDGDTSFWDKYVGSQLEGKRTYVPKQVPDSGSQLSNAFDRFDGVTMKNWDGKEIDKMTYASLCKEDAKLFNIFYSAAKSNRELTKEEDGEVKKINNKKREIVAPFRR